MVEETEEINEELETQAKDLDRRITALENFMNDFVRIECEECGRIFFIQKIDYDEIKKLSHFTFCPFNGSIAKKG